MTSYKVNTFGAKL